jgi:hypothetical protein
VAGQSAFGAVKFSGAEKEDAGRPSPAQELLLCAKHLFVAAMMVLGSSRSWRLDHPTTEVRLKKRIVRTVIHELIADIGTDAAEIVLLIHWVGGVHTEIRLPRQRRGQRKHLARW